VKTDLIDKLLVDKKVLVLGHRGSRKADVPENTLAAFERAFDVKADGIEIDVETSLDGKLVVVNRWFLNAEFSLFPWQGTLTEIQRLGLTKGIAIPTFDDACRLIKKRPQAVFNVEIKSSNTLLCRTAKAAMKVIKHHGIDDQVIVSSFDINTLLSTRLFHPTMETAYLFRQDDRVLNVEDKKRFSYKLNTLVNRSGIKGFLVGVDTLHPEIKLFPETGERLWLKAARLLGKRVNAWTVDSEENFEKALRAGVAVVISDRPEEVLGVLGEAGIMLNV